MFFTDTIFNNIVLGEIISEDRVYQVCRECSIYDDIMLLEDKFDTIISSSIHNFSGGQIKRISIVRAILQDRDILLLDEPTAGLDSGNSENILDCIRQYATHKLILIITHDEYLIRNADVVYKLENKQLIPSNSRLL